MSTNYANLTIGLDVGSTTVKAVVCDHDDQILWRDYQRHESRQKEKVTELLEQIEHRFKPADGFTIFITGSGGPPLATSIGARFVQEVNAVALAVERLHPDVGSVIELGGQDAKIIIFKDDRGNGRKRKIPSMNDKCAGGTGAVIDKISAKLHLPESDLGSLTYRDIKLHPVAAKCGVFAETDINGLQKSGVPTDQLMASLFDAIVMQNLTVLTRGNTLLPKVLLLGGPNTFIPGLADAWRYHIPKIWEERGVELPVDIAPEDLICVPDNAHYYAAIGAVEFGKTIPTAPPKYKGSSGLNTTFNVEVQTTRSRSSGTGLCDSQQELEKFLHDYTTKPFVPPRFARGQTVNGFIGLDSGSTTTKAVFLDESGEVVATAYQLSKGNPIDDSQEVLALLKQSVEQDGATMQVLGVVTTGYAKDVLKDALGADAALVETVAHTHSALHFYKDVDVICDVGGQDIKLIVLKNGRIKDFRLNTQCSAGNGYFLQNTAQNLGVSIEDFATSAFTARDYPQFGYGCSVFMQTDIVDFQRQGWEPEQILAGLAAVLPKNIWLYVAAIPNLASLGTRFLLQGGTQKNLAAVKAQVDFIQSRFAGTGVEASIKVHRFCGESGAIGAALEARRLHSRNHSTRFIGFDNVRDIRYRVHHNDDTVCHFCKNLCQRTFIDVQTQQDKPTQQDAGSKIPLRDGEIRVITGNSCDKGMVEDVTQMRFIKKDLDAVNADNPNLAEFAAKAVWKAPPHPEMVSASRWTSLIPSWATSVKVLEQRALLRIGIPKVLNMYALNPLFSGYFTSLGIIPRNLVYSESTSDELYKEGSRRSAIDPCFPSKVAIAHVHHLLYRLRKRKPVDIIFFPMIDTLDSDLADTVASCACPTVTATPETVKAALTKEEDLLQQAGVSYMDPILNVDNQVLFERQMLAAFGQILHLSPRENQHAVTQGYRALENFRNTLQTKGREVLQNLEDEQRLGIVVLGRSYHNDSGINHGIPEQLQAMGYPILTQDTLPTDRETLAKVFADDLRSGQIDDGMSISDVWKNSYSENTNRKVWAAKFTARHPNLVALELSSFKCGHDAPIYTVIEQIIEKSGTPYFCFKDLDENRPAGSIKIRLETMDYFLKRYLETQQELWGKQQKLEREVARYEAELRARCAS